LTTKKAENARKAARCHHNDLNVAPDLSVGPTGSTVKYLLLTNPSAGFSTEA